ncbi:biotin transporter BioY [Corallococcus sp. CA053C]|nr:biotin transporter BioY [Corallococcus sp. CA053C]
MPWWSSWSESLWRASWQGALCALAVWVLARAVPRLPASLRAGLWWLVALKFVLTLGWPRPVPLALLPAETVASVSPQARSTAPQSQTQGTQSQTSVLILQRDAGRSAPVAVQPRRLPTGDESPVLASFLADPMRSLRAWPWAQGVAWTLLLLWGAGVVWQVRGHVRAWQQVRGMRQRARPLQHPMLEEEAEFLASEAGLRRPPLLLVSDEVASPLAAGLLSPAIVLPSKAVRELPEDALRMALAHEVAHLRRGDLWLGWVPALAETVLFFHPLARQAAREYALAREEACDAEALRLTGAEPADYGELLIAFGITRPPGSAAALGASAHLHALHRRLRMLEHVDVIPTHPRRWLKGALFALGAVVLMPFQVVAKAPAASTPNATTDAGTKVGTTRTLNNEPTSGTDTTSKAPKAPAPPAPMDMEDGDTFAYLSDGRTMVVGSSDDVHLARTFKQKGKDIIFVRRDDKPFLIRDPQTLEQVRKLMEESGKLGDAQGALGQQQAALGQKQAALGQKQAEFAYPQTQLASKHAALASKRADIAMERARLATLADDTERDRQEAGLDKREEDLDREGEVLDQQQEEIGKKMEALGDQQEKLGEEQEKLGEQQAKLAEEQAARHHEQAKKVMRVVDEAIRKGLAEPLPT